MTSSVRKPCPASIPARSLAPVSSSATAPKRSLPVISTGKVKGLAYRLEAGVEARQHGHARAAFEEREGPRHRDLREDDRRDVLVPQLLDGRGQQLVVRRRVVGEQGLVSLGRDLLDDLDLGAGLGGGLAQKPGRGGERRREGRGDAYPPA